MMQKTSTAYAALGNVTVTLKTELGSKGELLDTEVIIEKGILEVDGGTICWINGEIREEFMNELNDALNKVVTKYRI